MKLTKHFCHFTSSLFRRSQILYSSIKIQLARSMEELNFDDEIKNLVVSI